MINDNIMEQVTDFKYLVYVISEHKFDLEDKLQTYNKINGAIGRYFWKTNEQRNEIDPSTSNDPYRDRTALLTSKVAFYIFIQQI